MSSGNWVSVKRVKRKKLMTKARFGQRASAQVQMDIIQRKNRRCKRTIHLSITGKTSEKVPSPFLEIRRYSKTKVSAKTSTQSSTSFLILIK